MQPYTRTHTQTKSCTHDTRKNSDMDAVGDTLRLVDPNPNFEEQLVHVVWLKLILAC